MEITLTHITCSQFTRHAAHELVWFGIWRFWPCLGGCHPGLSGCITTLTVRNTLEVANFSAAMDTLIDQDGGMPRKDGFIKWQLYFYNQARNIYILA